LGNNNAVNIVAAAATGYGNNISSALKNNNPALKSLSLSSNTTLLHNTLPQSPQLKGSTKNSLKETTHTNHDGEDTHSNNEKIDQKSSTSPTSQNKENINNKVKKKNSNSRIILKHNSSNTSLNSNSKINNALKLLSDADHYKEDDLECISLRKEAVEVLKVYIKIIIILLYN